MKSIEGTFFDGITPVSVDARLDFDDGGATLTAGTRTGQYASSHMRVTPRIATGKRFIYLPNGAQFLCDDQEFLDFLPQESPSEGMVAWLENRVKIAVASVVIIVLTLLSGYFYGLPALSKKIVDRIPMETEIALGEQILSLFDERNWTGPTELEYVNREKISEGFYRLCSELHFREYYRLEFRSGKLFGPNAFALPGGIVLVTDELVKTAEALEEVLALLAHEIGHVEMRHTMRSILQNSVVAAAATAVTSDAATLSAAVAGLPVIIAQKKYSREFETEADTYAFKLLKEKGISPEAFASMMKRLRGDEEDTPVGFSYLSTHPITKERIQRARDAAAEHEATP